MKFIIRHEMKCRLRIHVVRQRMTCAEADTLLWFLEKQENITGAKVYERTADAVVCYQGNREEVIRILRNFSFDQVTVPENVLSSSGRELNSAYTDRSISPARRFGNSGLSHVPPRRRRNTGRMDS